MLIDHHFFHIFEGGVCIPDEEGVFLTRRAAHVELWTSARDRSDARMRAGRGPGDGFIELMDLEGHLLERLSFRQVLN